MLRRYAFVRVYKVHLCYGGPEEGGWWYDRYHCHKAIKVEVADAEEVKQAFTLLYSNANLREYTSVLGGFKWQVEIERTAIADREETFRPVYE